MSAANPKLIIKDPVVLLDPSGTSLDMSNYCRQVSLAIAKKDVDVSAFGDPADEHAKGPGGHSATFLFLQSKDMSIVMARFVTEFNLDDTTTFSVKFKNTTVSPTNLKYTFDCLVNSIPIGAQRGEVSQMQVTYPISGQITQNDGTSDVLL